MTELNEIEEKAVNDVVNHFSDKSVPNTLIFFMSEKRESVRVANNLRSKGFKVKITQNGYMFYINQEISVSRN